MFINVQQCPIMPAMSPGIETPGKVGKPLEFRVGDFAVRCLDVCDALPKGRSGVSNLRDQLSRSATSVAANYAEATVPSSRRDFANKMAIAMRELVESRMWLYIISRRKYIKPHLLEALLSETDELVRIFSASISTARKRIFDDEMNPRKNTCDNDGNGGQ